MTDLLERLRACQGVLTHDPECNCAEAADEIERLTEEVNALRLVATAHDAEVEAERDKAWTRHLIEREDLKAEIEMLRAKVEQKSADLTLMAKRIDERDIEIERLKAERNDTKRMLEEILEKHGYPKLKSPQGISGGS